MKAKIQEYDSYKKISRFTKKKSAYTIEFITDDLPDEWLIDVVKYKTKSGIVTDNFVILRKDIEYQKSLIINDGFLEVLTEV